MEEVGSKLDFHTIILSDFVIKFSVYVNHNFVEQSILTKSTSISTVFLR